MGLVRAEVAGQVAPATLRPNVYPWDTAAHGLSLTILEAEFCAPQAPSAKGPLRVPGCARPEVAEIQSNCFV